MYGSCSFNELTTYLNLQEGSCAHDGYESIMDSVSLDEFSQVCQWSADANAYSDEVVPQTTQIATQPPDEPGCYEIEVIYRTETYAYENDWSIIDGVCDLNTLFESRWLVADSVTYTARCCLMPGYTYDLTCYDSYGDGWHGAAIHLNGRRYCGDSSGFLEQHLIHIPDDIPQCDYEKTELQVRTLLWDPAAMSWEITDENGNQRFCGGGSYDYSNYHASGLEFCCLPPGSYVIHCKNSDGNGWPDPNQNMEGPWIMIDGVKYCDDFDSGFSQEMPISITSETEDDGSCASDEHEVYIYFTTRSWPEEISWAVKTHGGEETDCNSSSISYDIENHNYEAEICCLPQNAYDMVCYDSHGDGWHGGFVVVNGQQMCRSANDENWREMPVEFNIPNEPSECLPGQESVEVVVITFGFADESSFYLHDSCSSSTGDLMDNEASSYSCCLDPGAYLLECRDEYGDGWNDGYILINNEQYCQNFEETSGDEPGRLMTATVFIGMEPCFDNLVTIQVTTTEWSNEVGWTIESQDASCSNTQQYNDDGTTHANEVCCLPDGMYTLTCTDSLQDGWHGGYLTIDGHKYCDDFASGESMQHQVPIPWYDTTCVDLVVTLDAKDYGAEISWMINEGGQCKGEDEYDSHSHYEKECCVNPGAIEVVCMDNYGDGWGNNMPNSDPSTLEIAGATICGPGFYNGHRQVEYVCLSRNEDGSASVDASGPCESAGRFSCEYMSLQSNGCNENFGTRHVTTEEARRCTASLCSKAQMWSMYELDEPNSYFHGSGFGCIVSDSTAITDGDSVCVNEHLASEEVEVTVVTHMPNDDQIIDWVIGGGLCSSSVVGDASDGETVCTLSSGIFDIECRVFELLDNEFHLGTEGWIEGTYIEIDGHIYCDDFTEGGSKMDSIYIRSAGEDCTIYDWVMTTDTVWSNEMSFEIVGVPACAMDGFTDGAVTEGSCCIPDGEYTLRCIDSHNDGWSTNAETPASFEINGETYCDNFFSGNLQQETITFGSPGCSKPDENLISIFIQTLEWAHEISWELMDTTCGAGIYNNNERVETLCCLPDGQYTLQCKDLYGDGWHGAFIEIDHVQYCADFLADEASTGTFTMEIVIVLVNGQINSVIVPSTTTPTTQSPCTNIEIEIHTMDFGEEFQWQIGDDGSCAGGPYHSWRVTTETCCLPMGQHTLYCLDAYGDGYHGGYIRVDTNQYCEDFNQGYQYTPITFNVLDVPITTTPNPNGCRNIDIGMRTYELGNQNLWVIDGGAAGCQGVGITDNHVHTTVCCLTPGEHTVECRSSASGWNGGYINIAGVYYCNDFQSGESIIRTFTIADSSDAVTAPPGFSYYEEYGICGQNNMLSEEECRTIAVSEGNYLSIETVEDWPPGCYRSPNGYLWYNTITTSVTNCHVTQYCYCSGDPPSTSAVTTMTPLSEDEYYQSYSFSCMLPLTYQECLAIFGQDSSPISLNAHDVPSGCFSNDGRVYYNSALTNVRCDHVDGGCACKGQEVTPPAIERRGDGTCDLVLSLSECQVEAENANAAFETEEVQGWPYGCYVYNEGIDPSANVFYFNTQPTMIECDSPLVVECRCHGFTSTTSIVSDTCQWANDNVCDEPFGFCPPGTDCTDCGTCIVDVPDPVDFTYVTIIDANCAKENTLTISECQQIAERYDISETTQVDTPYGCYEEAGGYFYYNSNDAGYGLCSPSRPCFCKSDVSTTTMPVEIVTEGQCTHQLTLEQCEERAAEVNMIVSAEETADFPPGCYVFWQTSWWYNYAFDAEVECEEHMECQCATDSQAEEGIKVRLSNAFYGVLEAQVNGGRWGNVCNTGFFDSPANALAVCYEVMQGHTVIQAAVFARQTSDTTSTTFTIDNVACPPEAQSLNECEMETDVECMSHQSVWIQCHQNVEVGLYLDQNSGLNSAGILMAQITDTVFDIAYPSGYVCDERFDIDDNAARVACNQLGLGGGDVQVSSINRPSFNVDVAIDNVRCLGSESSMSECSFSLDSSYCSSWEVVYLDCNYVKPSWINVRLTEGIGTGFGTHGVLEAQVDNGVWGSVCDDHSGSYSYQYNGNVATLVCQQLGYAGFLHYHNQAINERDYVLDNVACNGDEDALVECTYLTNHNCLSGEGLYIECDTSTETTTSTQPHQTRDPSAPATTTQSVLALRVHMTVMNVNLGKFQVQSTRDMFTSFFAQAAQISDVEKVYLATPEFGRRRMQNQIEVVFEVSVDNPDEAMAVANRVNTGAFVQTLEDLSRTLDGWQRVSILRDTAEVERSNCEIRGSVNLRQGDVLRTPNVFTYQDSVDACILQCIFHTMCKAYSYRTNMQCTLFSAFHDDDPYQDDISVQFAGICAEIKEDETTLAPTVTTSTTTEITPAPTDTTPIPTEMTPAPTETTLRSTQKVTEKVTEKIEAETTIEITKKPGKPIPTKVEEESESSTLTKSENTDDENSKRTVVIILAVVILVIVIAIMVYCAYNYGKNRKLQMQQIRQLEEFEIRAPQRAYISRPEPALQTNPIVHEIVYQTSPSAHFPQPNIGGASVEGPRFTTGLEYLASQPHISVMAEAPVHTSPSMIHEHSRIIQSGTDQVPYPIPKDVETIQF